MPSQQIPSTDLPTAVRAMFANRPTLRQVAGEQLMTIMLARYPLIAVHRPTLKSAEPLFLMRPQPDGGWTSKPLVDVLLQALLDATLLDFSGVEGLDCHFSLEPPHRFFAIESSFDTADGDLIRAQALEAGFNALLPRLHEHFCTAQIHYWNGDRAEIDRGLWLQQMLRLSLFNGLRNEALDADQRGCLHDLLLGRTRGFTVQAVRIRLQAAGSRYSKILPNLLVTASSEVRRLMLWCSPAGEVRCFDSMEAFAIALQARMSVLYRFEGLSWELLDGEHDAFALQVALLLETLLQRLARVRRSLARSVDELEEMYAQACEPSHFFAPRREPASIAATLKLPGGLRRAGKDDQTAYAQVVLDLAVLQSASGGDYSLEGVEDLHSYTKRRLREEMLADHPLDANYFSDDLLLTVDTFADDGHGLGFGQQIGSKTITLAELAVGRLDATHAGVVTAIRHRQGQLIMGWMTVDYLRELVGRVDIGGTYPLYVNAQLDNVDTREQRFARFAEQWRLTLHFDAVRARVIKAIDVSAYRVLEQFCRQGKARVRMAPLAFKRSPTSQVIDQVHGMYVIELSEPSVLLLYCPLYPHNALAQFVDAQALMAAISEPGALQEAVLMWLEQPQRAIYDNGGFREPHLLHWQFDPFDPLEKPAPAQLVKQFHGQDLDRYMFEARRKLMIEVADRSAMSNSEQRWAVIKAFSWQLLNAILPVLPGPVAAVAWLYAGIQGLVDDVEALASNDTSTVTEAVVDLLNNTLMALIHLQLPTPQPGGAYPVTPLRRQGELALGDGLSLLPGAQPAPGDAVSISTLQVGVDTVLDFSWHGAGGVNGLSPTQRGRLRQLVADVSVVGRRPEQMGAATGLYRLSERYYVLLGYDVYEVLLDDGAWIVGPDKTVGPALISDNGTWRISTGLLGGSGRSPAQARVRQKLEARIKHSLDEVEQHLVAAGLGTSKYQTLGAEIEALQVRLDKLDLELQQPPPVDPEKREQYQRLHDLYSQKQQEVSSQKRLKRVERIETVALLHGAYLGAEAGMIALFDNPSFVRGTASAASARQTLVEVRQNLIGYGMFTIDEVLEISDLSGYQVLVDELNSSPENKRAELYRRYVHMLEGIVTDQPLIIEASSQLDRLLAITDASLEIPYGAEPMSVEQIIAKRQSSTVAIRFFQAMNLAEIALQLRKRSHRRLRTFRQTLASVRLRVAANTHHLSLYCDLPLGERIEILQSAWDEYVAAILNSERLKGLGDKLIDSQRLEAYKQQMIELKAMAADALIEAVREQASGQAMAPRRAVYPRKALQVAHTRDGQIVIGSETIIDGNAVLQVQAAFSSEVSHSFHRQGSVWVEDARAGESEPEVLDAPSAIDEQVGVFVEGLLADNDQVMERAARMVEEDADDQGLIDLLDGYIRNLSGLADQLPAGKEAEALLQRLRSAIIRLREEKIRLLTTLYANTRYPKARGLAFLHEHDLVSVEYVGPRRKDADGYLDEYRISLKASQGKKAKPLWAAHFHFADAQASPTAFGKGHLKLWGQRLQGYKDQMVAAKAGQVLRIYRGGLTYAQAKDIIPFHDFGR